MAGGSSVSLSPERPAVRLLPRMPAVRRITLCDRASFLLGAMLWRDARMWKAAFASNAPRACACHACRGSRRSERAYLVQVAYVVAVAAALLAIAEQVSGR